MESIDEVKLIRELKAGSISAFNELYERYFPKVYSYCLQISKSPHKAVDITQEVFLKLWEHRKAIRSEESINPFLFKMAKNNLISAYREALNSKTYEDYVLYSQSLYQEKSSHIEYMDFLRILNHAVMELPKNEREVLKMSRMQLMKNKEIAAQLGLSEQTVKNRLVSAVKHLRELLNKGGHLTLLYFVLINT